MQNYKELFAEKINNSVIPSSMPKDEQDSIMGELSNLSRKFLPNKLFRFRRINDLNISAFDKDQLWVSTAECMNDGFDSRLFVDMNEVHEWSNQLFAKPIKKEDLMNNNINSPIMMQIFSQIKPFLLQLPTEEFEKIINGFQYWVSEQINSVEELIPIIAQQTIKFCCFAENIHSAAMWGLYASDETGFALEYDFMSEPLIEPSFQPNIRICSLFPIIYGEKRFQVPSDYVTFLLQYKMIYQVLYLSGIMKNNPMLAGTILNSGICPDIFMATKVSINKSIEWEREREWRLFCSGSDGDIEFQSAKHGYCIKKPTGVYLGRRIKPINEKIIRKLADEKGIPVYKMKLDDQSHSYDLIVES